MEDCCRGRQAFLLAKRIISALIAIPLGILIAYEGKLFFLSVILFITVTGLYELRNLMLRMNLRLPPLLMYGNGVLFPVVVYFLYGSNQALLLYAIVTFSLMLCLTAMIISFPRYSAAEIAVSYLGSSYIGILISYLLIIRHMSPDGFYYLLYLLIMTWAYDAGAYFAGVYLGRHLLYPALSPKKTLEGLAGGLLLTVGAALVFQRLHPIGSYFDTVALSLLIGVFVQVGDLVESALKRMAGVKDSGTMIPGHGGVLDRFDGLLFSAPVAYLFLKLVLFR
jgi:phosphatidate cytidylyltransferase